VAVAQVATGTISGTVKDSSGAVLPGAKVGILNQDTGIVRTMDADASGHYVASSLTLGNYRVTAAAQGFQTEVRSGIVLTVGQEAVVDMTMPVGASTQTVEVAGEAPSVETTNATVSGLVSGAQMRDLPLNGRSYTDLALLEPGVLYDRTTGTDNASGFGVRLSVNGSRNGASLFLMDGSVINDATETAGGPSQQSLGVDSILEFRVLTHNYSAEYGRVSGAIVSTVTRSGTNQWHGSAYEFVRNSMFDARDFFQIGPVAPFRRNQFGGTAGAPIKKDRIFFFVNYEGLRQRLSMPIIATVPSASARAGSLQTGNVTVSPLIKPYLDLFPLPNSTVFPDGTGFYNTNFSQPTDEDYFTGRMDFRLSNKDNLYYRYVFDPATRVRPTPIPFWSSVDDGTNHYVALSETHIFSATAVNSLTFGFNRTSRLTGLGAPTISYPASLSFAPGQPLGQFAFTATGIAGGASGGAISTFGYLNGSPSNNLQNLFQETDTFNLIRGSHSIKLGIDLERSQLNTFSNGGVRGVWTFSSLQNLLTASPANLQGKLLGQIPSGGVSVTGFGWRRWLLGWFVQDDWRINSRLTLNVGLRHEFFTDPYEVNGLNAALVHLTDSTSTIGVPFHAAKMNFAPRLGMAWDPAGNGKTSIRWGIGVYHNQIDGREWNAFTSDYQFSASYTITCPCPSFPFLPADPPLTSAKSEVAAQNDLATPTVIQYGLDVQRQLTRGLSVRVGYVGWKGYNMTRSTDQNIRVATICPASPCPAGLPDGTKYFATTSPKINPNFSTITQLRADIDANYNGLQAMIQQTSGFGLTFQGSYTLSKALSTNDSVVNRQIDNGGPWINLDVNDPNRDYSRSSYDQRQTFSFNSSYKMPWDRYLKNRAAVIAFGGWEARGIWTYGSGLPLNINLQFNNSNNGDTNNPDRPSVAPGFSNDPTHGVTAGCGNGVIPAGQKLHTPNRWYDPCAFILPTAGTYGNLGRNTVSGPDFNYVSFSLVKNTALTERTKLEFRAEAFNLFNHPSFGLPALQVFSSSRVHTGNEGVITTTSSNGRQIQLGMKLVF